MKSSSLQSLVGSQTGADSPVDRAPTRHWRWLPATIPWLLLGGFLGVAWLLFGDQLQPSTAVRLESVIATRPAANGPETSTNTERAAAPDADPWEAPVQFQASGWVEPDPLPIKATALVNGVVESVSVLEGESVQKGQPLATLIREDFELDLETAKADLASLKAQAEAHESSIAAAKAAIQTLEMQVKAGRKKCLELQDQYERFIQSATGAVAERDLIQAKLRMETHASEVDALAISRDELVNDQRRLEARRDEFAAMVARAETEVARKRLALDRTEIRSPVDGIVLRLLAVPGQKRMLDMDDPDSATVAILYQPDSLQARIDVPLEEAAQLAVGQAVNLRSNFLPSRVFHGTVTRIVGEADLQRNTLQAKVRIQDPDIRLRPDMLCRAEFLAAAAADGDASVSGGPARSNRLVLFVPEAALLNRQGNEATAWTVDASGERLERRKLVLGSNTREGHVSVREGLRPGDRVVIDPSAELAEGDRIKPLTPESPSKP